MSWARNALPTPGCSVRCSGPALLYPHPATYSSWPQQALFLTALAHGGLLCLASQPLISSLGTVPHMIGPHNMRCFQGAWCRNLQPDGGGPHSVLLGGSPSDHKPCLSVPQCITTQVLKTLPSALPVRIARAAPHNSTGPRAGETEA